MMDVDRDSRSAALVKMQAWWLFLVRLLLVGGSIYLVWRTKSILTTLIVSLVLASAVSALVTPLCRSRLMRGFRQHHVRRTVSAVLVFVLLAIFLFIAGEFLVHPFRVEYEKLVTNWPTYQTQLLDLVERAQALYGDLPAPLRQALERQQKTTEIPGTGMVPTLLGTTVSWASHVIELILLPVLAFYFVVDGRSLKKEFLRFVPRERLRTILAIGAESSAIMRAYLIAQFWLALIAGVVVWGMLTLFRMDYAVILGIIAGVTRAVPVIGPLLGGVPVVTLAFVQAMQRGDHGLWIGILVAFTVLHLVESKIIMPRFLGHQLHLHAVIIIVALLLGGEFFGLLGMFLAAPVVALVRSLLLHYLVYPRQRPGDASRRATRKKGRAGTARLGRAINPTPATSAAVLKATKE